MAKTTFLQRAERALKTGNSRMLGVSHWWKRHLSRRGTWIFINAQPKSGSTYLTTLAADATGYLRFFLGDHHENEQDLYLPRLLDAWSMNIVCHQHTWPTGPNLDRMRAFGMRPVILLRNIHDVTASIRDHLARSPRHKNRFPNDAAFELMSEEAQFDAIIDFILPLHLQFAYGWQKAGIEHLTLTYEEMVAAPAETLGRVLAFNGIERSAAELEGVVAAQRARADINFNKGVSGRGLTLLTERQMACISELASRFPDADFTPIGLGEAERVREVR